MGIPGLSAIEDLGQVGVNTFDIVKGYFELANGFPYAILGEYKIELGDEVKVSEGQKAVFKKNPKIPATKLKFKITGNDVEKQRTTQIQKAIDLAKIENGKPEDFFKNLDGKIETTIDEDLARFKIDEIKSYTTEIKVTRIPNERRTVYLDLSGTIEIIDSNSVTSKPIFILGENITGKLERKKRELITITKPYEHNITYWEEDEYGDTTEIHENIKGVSKYKISQPLASNQKVDKDSPLDYYYDTITPPMTFPPMASKVGQLVIQIKNAKIFDSSLLSLGIANAVNTFGGIDILKKTGLKNILGKYFGFDIKSRIKLLEDFLKKRSMLLFSYKNLHYDILMLEGYTIKHIPDEENAFDIDLTLKSLNILYDKTQKSIINLFENIKNPSLNTSDNILSGRKPETESQSIRQDIDNKNPVAEKIEGKKLDDVKYNEQKIKNINRIEAQNQTIDKLPEVKQKSIEGRIQ